MWVVFDVGSRMGRLFRVSGLGLLQAVRLGTLEKRTVRLAASDGGTDGRKTAVTIQDFFSGKMR